MRREVAAAVLLAIAGLVAGTASTYAVLQATKDDPWADEMVSYEYPPEKEFCFESELVVKFAGPQAAWVDRDMRPSNLWLTGDWRVGDLPDRVYLGDWMMNGQPWTVTLRECHVPNGISLYLESAEES